MRWYIKKVIVLVIIFLFFGIAVQPATSIDIIQVDTSKEVEKFKQLNNDEIKDYLFETLIEISNNHDVKDLLDQSENMIVLSDYDINEYLKILFVKNPLLLFSIILTRPSMTCDSLNDIYNKGVEVVNILGEDKVIEITRSSDFINKEIINELIYKTKDNEELSLKFSELERLNNELKKDSPFQNFSIICAFLIIIDVFLILLLAIILMFILMMPGKFLWHFLTALIPIFAVQVFVVTYLIDLLHCIKTF